MGLAQAADGICQQAGVEVKADGGNLAVLAHAQDVAGAADFEVAHGNGIAGAKLGVFGDGFEALAALNGGRAAAVAEEVGVGALGAATHPAAQLVELGQAKGIGAVNDEGVGIGDIQAGFDDGGAQEDIHVAGGEFFHALGQALFGHLAVGHCHAGFGHQLLKVGAHGADGLDPVVDEEDLPAAL